MVELMETKTALSVTEADATELQERFGDRVRPGTIAALLEINTRYLTEKAGGTFSIFVPDVARRRTEEQLARFYNTLQPDERYANL